MEVLRESIPTMQSFRESMFDFSSPAVFLESDEDATFVRQSMASAFGGGALVFADNNLRGTLSGPALRKTRTTSSAFANGNDDSEATTPHPPPPAPTEKTLAAIALVMLAGVIATLQGAGIQVVGRYGFRWSSLVASTSFIGGCFFGAIYVCKGGPFVTHPSKMSPMLKRGLLGGVANCCGYYAVR